MTKAPGGTPAEGSEASTANLRGIEAALCERRLAAVGVERTIRNDGNRKTNRMHLQVYQLCNVGHASQTFVSTEVAHGSTWDSVGSATTHASATGHRQPRAVTTNTTIATLVSS